MVDRSEHPWAPDLAAPGGIRSGQNAPTRSGLSSLSRDSSRLRVATSRSAAELSRSLRARQTLAALLGAGLSLIGCERSPTPAAAASAPPQAAAEVRTAVAGMEPWSRVLRVSGNLAVAERSVLGAKVAGRLQEVQVDVGAVVAADDVLARIDPIDYQLSIVRATAQVRRARALLGMEDVGDESLRDAAIQPSETASVKEAIAVRDEAIARQARAHSLRDQGIATPAEVDVADAAAGVAEARLRTATQGVKSLIADLQTRLAELDLAEAELAGTAIVAPYDGVILTRLAGRGDYLGTGAAILELVRIDPLRLRLEIPERAAAGVRLGLPVRFQVDGVAEALEVEISRVPPELDVANRSLAAEADVPNPVVKGVPRLRGGSFVEASIVLEPDAVALCVPAAALRAFAGVERVLVVEDGKVRERLVTIGRRETERLEVLRGVAVGDLVILDPGSLSEGRAVRVVE